LSSRLTLIFDLDLDVNLREFPDPQPPLSPPDGPRCRPNLKISHAHEILKLGRAAGVGQEGGHGGGAKAVAGSRGFP
jgi:hypothetical protein